MEYSDKLEEFLNGYKKYEKSVLRPTLKEVNNHLKEWEETGYWSKHTTGKGVATPSPIRMIMTRIKHPEKVVEKIYRRPDLFPSELSRESFMSMRDTIGIRIIVYFSSQLSLIDRELRSSDVIELSEEAPPKAYFDRETLNKLGLSHINNKYKESGYSSIHYVGSLKGSKMEEKPFFEIQVRTLAQEVWGELEHVLSYKPETRPHFSAKRRFQILSREIAVLDEQFNLLYEELIHSQEIASYMETDTITFENAPKVLGELGIQCSLTELNPILKVLFSRDIVTVKDLLDIATPIRLVTIRNTFISNTGHAPTNLDIVAILSALKGVNSKEVEIERIKSQIRILNQNGNN